jgi:C1A family cysteine protease
MKVLGGIRGVGVVLFLAGVTVSAPASTPPWGGSVLAPRDARDIPESWDWRELGGMTPVRSQSECNCAWAFAATGALESLYLITTGEMEDFSEQQCLACNEYGADCTE